MGVFRWVTCALLAFYPSYQISTASLPDNEKSVNINEIYQTLEESEISYEAFIHAFNGFFKIKSYNKKINDSILTIIDYSLPSTKERLIIVDLKNKKLLKKSLVAHGKGSGTQYARCFSNIPKSHQSSLGFFITENTYHGKHGYSLRISGIEKGINDNARERAIVFHGANYVSKNFIKKHGRLGRSFGCPALPLDDNQAIIDIIRGESCVFVFYPDENYLTQSLLLNSMSDRP